MSADYIISFILMFVSIMIQNVNIFKSSELVMNDCITDLVEYN